MGDREEGKKGRGSGERSNKSDSAIPATWSFDFFYWTRLSSMQLKKKMKLALESVSRATQTNVRIALSAPTQLWEKI